MINLSQRDFTPNGVEKIAFTASTLADAAGVHPATVINNLPPGSYREGGTYIIPRLAGKQFIAQRQAMKKERG